MPQDPNLHFDQTVLEMIEHSSTGSVPNTPAYQDALNRLRASHQVYASADHKDGHVTARSLTKVAIFQAGNLEAFVAGQITGEELEKNGAIFDRYAHSLPAAQKAKAESHRTAVAGRAILHRHKVGVTVHDPVHTLFLVPGTGPHFGLPGNYLHGSVAQAGADPATGRWLVQLHDIDDGLASYDAPDKADAFAKLAEVVASAPFNMNELEALGFKIL